MNPATVLLLGVILALSGLLIWMWVRHRKLETHLGQAVRERAESIAAREALARDLKETRGNLESVGSANLDALLLLDKNRRDRVGQSGCVGDVRRQTRRSADRASSALSMITN